MNTLCGIAPNGEQYGIRFDQKTILMVPRIIHKKWLDGYFSAEQVSVFNQYVCSICNSVDFPSLMYEYYQLYMEQLNASTFTKPIDPSGNHH